VAAVIRPGALALTLTLLGAPAAGTQPATPQLTEGVNDLANVIDPASEAELQRRIDALMSASGDVVVVATVPNMQGFADMSELKLRLFENHGRGVGKKGKDNGLLLAVAVAERKMGVEIGYDLEGIITDGFAGQVIRERIAPQFRDGRYGEGLLAGTTTLITRIAEARGVQLNDVPRERAPLQRRAPGGGIPVWVIVLIIIILMSRGGGRRRRGPFLWTSGVGPFGGGFGGGSFGGFGSGGFGGGGFGGGGGGFGGFGGGRSGGGGATGGW
jgi:uncharacterized protein